VTPVQNPIIFPFDPMGETLLSLGFTSMPSTLDAEVVSLPVSDTYPHATNGVGLQVSPPANQLSLISGPGVELLDTPVRITCWYNASHDGFQIAVGAFADQNGQAGASVYAMNTAPEYTPGTWHKIEIEVDAQYTKVVPFLAMYNTHPDGEGTVSFDNLEIYYGPETDLGMEITIDDWIPNLWLSEADKGFAYRLSDSFVLEKTFTQKASRFVGSYAQSVVPYRTSVEIVFEKWWGFSGTLTIWIGNGPSAVQNDIPLWMLMPYVNHTIRVSNVTIDTPGPVYVVLQIAGEDNVLLEIRSVRVNRLSNAALRE
jgi:hypothetical protein